MTTLRSTYTHKKDDGTKVYYDGTVKFLGETILVTVRTGSGESRRIVFEASHHASKRNTVDQIETYLSHAIAKAVEHDNPMSDPFGKLSLGKL